MGELGGGAIEEALSGMGTGRFAGEQRVFVGKSFSSAPFVLEGKNGVRSRGPTHGRWMVCCNWGAPRPLPGSATRQALPQGPRGSSSMPGTGAPKRWINIFKASGRHTGHRCASAHGRATTPAQHTQYLPTYGAGSGIHTSSSFLPCTLDARYCVCHEKPLRRSAPASFLSHVFLEKK